MAGLFRSNELYIYNDPNKIEAAYGALSSAKEKLIEQYNSKNFSFKKQIKENFGLKNLPKETLQAYFDFLDEFRTAELKGGNLDDYEVKTINELLDKYDPYTNVTASFGEYESLNDALNKLRETKDFFVLKDISTQLEQILADAVGTKNSPLSGGNRINTELFKEFLLNPKEIKHFRQTGSFSKEFFSQLDSIIQENGAGQQEFLGIENSKITGSVNNYLNTFRRIQAFTSLIDNLSKTESGVQTISSNIDIFYKIAKIITGKIQRALGFVFEPYVANLVNETQNKLIDQMADKIAKGTNHRITSENSVSTQSGAKTRAVQDVGGATINILMPGEANKGTIEIEVPLPGASVKHLAEVSVNKNRSVKVKSSGANLSNLIHDMPIRNISLIYNIIASYGKKGWRGGYKFASNPITDSIWSDFKEGLKLILLINGLAGQMTQEDFSYFLIVNGVTFTMEEVVRSLYEEAAHQVEGAFLNNMSKNIIFSPSQESVMKANSFVIANAEKVKYGRKKEQNLSPNKNAALQRSQMACEALRKLKIKNEIRISINNLSLNQI